MRMAADWKLPHRLSPPRACPSLECQNHALSQRHVRIRRCFEGVSHRVDHFTAHQDVALDDVAITLPTARPLAVLRTGMGRRAPPDVEHRELAQLPPLVVAEQSLQNRSRIKPLLQQVESLAPIFDDGPGLGRDGANASSNPRPRRDRRTAHGW